MQETDFSPKKKMQEQINAFLSLSYTTRIGTITERWFAGGRRESSLFMHLVRLCWSVILQSQMIFTQTLFELIGIYLIE
jgi:hypothetical protein